METWPKRQIALQALVAEARRQIAAIAVEEDRLFRARDKGLDHCWRLGKTLVALKEQLGRGNWYIWLEANLPAIGNTETMRRRNAARCMALFHDNPDRRNSSDGFSVESIRRFWWNYVPAKERLQLEGDEKIKPGPHHLRWVNEFLKYDRQLRTGRVDGFNVEIFRREVEPMLRRIAELGGQEWFRGLS
jgi:hypothetical protein